MKLGRSYRQLRKVKYSDIWVISRGVGQCHFVRILRLLSTDIDTTHTHTHTHTIDAR